MGGSQLALAFPNGYRVLSTRVLGISLCRAGSSCGLKAIFFSLLRRFLQSY